MFTRCARCQKDQKHHTPSSLSNLLTIWCASVDVMRADLRRYSGQLPRGHLLLLMVLAPHLPFPPAHTFVRCDRGTGDTQSLPTHTNLVHLSCALRPTPGVLSGDKEPSPSTASLSARCDAIHPTPPTRTHLPRACVQMGVEHFVPLRQGSLCSCPFLSPLEAQRPVSNPLNGDSFRHGVSVQSKTGSAHSS